MSDEIEVPEEGSAPQFDTSVTLERTFTIKMVLQATEEGELKPAYSFLPGGDGVQPFDCVELATEGLRWAVRQHRKAMAMVLAAQMERVEAPRNRAERRHPEKRTRGGIIIPEGSLIKH